MRKFRTAIKTIAATGALMIGLGGANAQDIDIEELSDGLYVIYGPGGNIGMSEGEEGVFLIDDKFARLSEDLLQAISEINDGEVHFLLNTHYHGDHTGANEEFAKTGTILISHDNVRTRLIGRNMPEAALPVITYNDQASIFINGLEARIIHFANAHTDGDSIIFFESANLIHTGDIYFNALFPYIDVDAGGSVNDNIAAVEAILEMSNDDTIFIPGHGQVSNNAGLEEYRVMLVTIRDRVKVLKDAGATLEEALAANLVEGYEDWSWAVDSELMVTAVYNSL